jgi:hypothetical protein
MATQPKVSHFNDEESLDRYPSMLNDKSELSSLYATPKTYTQRRQDDLVRQVRLRRQRPKYPYVNIALYGALMFAFVMWFGQNLGRWWVGNGTDLAATMSNVFLSFGIGMVALVLLVRWILYTHEMLTHFNGVPRIFWIIYAATVLVIVALWLSGLGGGYGNIVWIPILGAIHFVVTFIAAKANANYSG